MYNTHCVNWLLLMFSIQVPAKAFNFAFQPPVIKHTCFCAQFGKNNKNWPDSDFEQKIFNYIIQLELDPNNRAITIRSNKNSHKDHAKKCTDFAALVVNIIY